MRIVIQTIPHSLQRYNTVGDWYSDKRSGQVNINVSQMSNWRFQLLIGIHELVEAFLCLHIGISEEAVDKFDKQFVARDEEPGDSDDAPYRIQHCIATGVERIIAGIFGISWKRYEEVIEDLIIKREEAEKNAIRAKA